ARIEAGIEDAQNKRSALLSRLLSAAADPSYNAVEEPEGSVVDRMAEDLACKRSELDEVLAALMKTEARQTEVKKYQDLVAEEIARMQRARQAGALLADIKITHCPACDREIEPPSEDTAICYLCGRENDISAD